MIAGVVNSVPVLVDLGVGVAALGAIGLIAQTLSTLRGDRIQRAPLALAGGSPITLEVGDAGPFVQTRNHNLYQTHRTFNLRLANTDPRKPLGDVRVRIMQVKPPAEHHGPWLLQEGLNLAGGGHVFFPLVTYGEARGSAKAAVGDPYITMGTETGRPFLPIVEPSILTIRATAADVLLCEVRVRVWLGEDGGLRIEKAG